ncbi:MAG TPA: hypothetical protein VFK44_04555 [Bacillales bacterium]|nr:hypothetical protein [Bacillales bacterium]
MENQLNELRTVLDETIFQDGELSERAKSEIRDKIKRKRQSASPKTVRRFAPWIRPVLTTAAALLIFACVVYSSISPESRNPTIQEGHRGAAFPYPDLLSSEHGQYYILSVKKNGTKGSSTVFNHLGDLDNVIDGVQENNLDAARHGYPKLNIPRAPYFFVFDEKGVVLQTGDERQVLDFLKNRFPYPSLLSDKEGKFFALLIGDEAIESFQHKPAVLDEMLTGVWPMQLKAAQRAFAELHIDKSPTYMLFDTNGIVLRTGDLEDALDLLQSHYNQAESHFPYKNLLSDRTSKLAALVVDESPGAVSFTRTGVGPNPVVAQMSEMAPQQARTAYPKLQIPKTGPYYVFFNSREIVFRTDSEQEAAAFVRTKQEAALNETFAPVLQKADVRFQKIVSVQPYDADLNDVPESAFIFYMNEDRRMVAGRLERKGGTWTWVKGSAHRWTSDHSFDMVPGKGPVQLLYGVYGPEIAKVRVDGHEPNRVLLDSGKTLWFSVGDDFNAVTGYKIGGEVAFTKSFTSDDEKAENGASFKAFYQNDRPHAFIDFYLTDAEKTKVRDTLAQLGVDDLDGASFLPTEVPKGTEFTGVAIAKSDSKYYGPRGPFLVLRFNTFQISVQIPEPRGGVRRKGTRITTMAIEGGKAQWYRRSNADGAYYALDLFQERWISISSPLKRISHTDVENIAASLISLKEASTK